MNRSTNARRALGGVLMVALAAACTPDAAVGPDLSPELAVGDRVFDESTVRPGVGLVCAFYPDDNVYGPSTFSSSATGGDVLVGNFDIEPVPNCVEVWNATDESLVLLGASLLGDPSNLVLDRIVTLVGDGTGDPTVTTYYGASEVTEAVSSTVGANLWFKFNMTEEPPSGGQGCTPGYWRQRQHFDSWTAPYDPTDPFSSVFANAFPGQTLLDVVWARGGGVNALGRHAVAALLNAASAGVDYDYTVAEVVELFNAAYASGDRNTMTQQKDVFDFLNNQGCTLN